MILARSETYLRLSLIHILQIPNLLVVVQIGALDGVGAADAVCLVLVVDGQVCQMGQMCIRDRVWPGAQSSRPQLKMDNSILLV